MPRKEINDIDPYFRVLPVRLRELLKETKTTQATIAEILGVSRQMVSQYCNGTSAPDWTTIIKICEFFSVSADYLIGLSEVKNNDTEVRAVSDYTGLSEKSINYFNMLNENRKLNKNDKRLEMLNAIFESERFIKIVSALALGE